MRVATADGRTYLQGHDDRYDAIFLDAFRQPYIPFYLTTQEFWSLTHDRLRPGGMVMANVGRVPGDDRLPDAIAGTMATRFATVVEWPVGDFNVIVAGFEQHVSMPQLIARLGRAPAGLAGVRDAALGDAGGGAVVGSAHRRPRAGRVADRPDDRALRRRGRNREVDTLQAWLCPYGECSRAVRSACSWP